MCFVNMFDNALSDSDVLYLYTGTTTERGLMTIGIENDGGYINNDRIALWPNNGTGFVGINTKTPLYSLDISGILNTNAGASINGVSIGRGTGNVATNTAVGFEALKLNTLGYRNVAVGYQALQTNTTGYENTVVGTFALQNTIGQIRNTAVGFGAGNGDNPAQVGDYNTFIGSNTYQAGNGTHNTYLGYGAYSSGNYGNSTAIGTGALITMSNQIKLGRETNTEYVYCGSALRLNPTNGNCDIRNLNSGYNLNFGIGTTDYLTVNSSGTSSTSFNATSDYRVKENVVPLDDSFTIDVLNPVTYNLKSSGKQDIGFIAHEVQEFYPFLVLGEKDGKETQSLNYNGFIGILTKEIQVLKKKVLDQEARIAEHERKALEQEARISEQDQRIQALEI